MLITFITFILLNLALEYIGPYSLAVKGALSHHQQRRTNSTIQNQPGSQNGHSDQLLLNKFFDSSSHFIRRGYACALFDSKFVNERPAKHGMLFFYFDSSGWHCCQSDPGGCRQ